MRLCLKSIEQTRSEIVYHDPDYLSSISVSLTREDIEEQVKEAQRKKVRESQKKWATSQEQLEKLEKEAEALALSKISQAASSNSNLANQKLYCIHTELLIHIYRNEMVCFESQDFFFFFFFFFEKDEDNDDVDAVQESAI